MPRQPRPLDPNAGPVQAFAAELRKLWEEANKPTFLGMHRKTGRSRTALSEAVGGDHLPTWDTVAAFVRACGGDVAVWRAKWEQADEQVKATSREAASTAEPVAAEPSAESAEPEANEPPRQGRLRRAVPLLVASLGGAAVASAVTAVVMANISHSTSGQPISAGQHVSTPAVITVQNKVALGASQLIEDTTPAYLSSRPIPYCSRLGCELPNTAVSSGALLVAVCHATGTEMFNYDLDSSESKTNPNRADSALWYKVVLPDGRAGYLSEVYVVAANRGGMGLPVCR